LPKNDFKGEFTFFLPENCPRSGFYYYISGVMKIPIKHLFVAGFLLASSYAAYAGAAPPPPGGGQPPPCWPPPCIPIDGGVSFLLAAAAIYGGKKLYDHQKKS